MTVFYPCGWKEYELIDTGNQEKLERFGDFILARPEPQAVWQKALHEDEWDKLLHARFKRRKGFNPGKDEPADQGTWIREKSMPDQWAIYYRSNGLSLRFRLGLTSFGHIGVFPEQADNWNYIYHCIKQWGDAQREGEDPHLSDRSTNGQTMHRKDSPAVKVLNLFAYTGGSSLAARAAGADVIHVDSVKPVVTWAREMMEGSGMKDIRWVVEDAMKFVKREVKRGNKYQGIILDPPAYGRGPEGEKWILQEGINELIALCNKLMDPARAFFVLSFYSMGFSSLIGENLIRSHFGDIAGRETGELCFKDRSGKTLPLGTVVRFNYK